MVAAVSATQRHLTLSLFPASPTILSLAKLPAKTASLCNLRICLRSWEEQTKALIQFRICISDSVYKCFHALVFHKASASIRVKPRDYQCVSKLDERVHVIKVCVLTRQYITTLADRGDDGGTTRNVVWAKKLNDHAMKQLAAEPKFLCSLEKAIGAILKHYTVTESTTDAVLQARRIALKHAAESKPSLGQGIYKVYLYLASPYMSASSKKVAGSSSLGHVWHRLLYFESFHFGF